jgi:hypothetical protein
MPKASKKSQVEKFREAARKAGTDESEARFNTTLKDLAKAPREPKGEGPLDEETVPKP